eukprot:TRINITY_DN22022_c0_g1_i8.p1 TRINITY_DN22022_c0_g1~~TRINITY_DN22022_c0_g1_i8.p1  ORF type:complete len:364 (-),score=34.81 TRINITY_DN22022_c0_g1_i8:244-1335(-)
MNFAKQRVEDQLHNKEHFSQFQSSKQSHLLPTYRHYQLTKAPYSLIPQHKWATLISHVCCKKPKSIARILTSQTKTTTRRKKSVRLRSLRLTYQIYYQSKKQQRRFQWIQKPGNEQNGSLSVQMKRCKKLHKKIVDEWKSQVSKQNTDSQKDSSTKSKSSSKSTDTVDQKVTDKAQSKDTPGRTPTPLKNEGPTRLSTTGDTRRDGVAKKFLEALKLVGEEEVYNPVAVAARIERALFAHFGSFNEQYKSKVKSLLFNLKDPKNPDLRKRVLSGEVDGGKFITMSPEEMQSAEQRKEVEKIREELCQEAQRGIDQKEGTTDQFQCGKCRQRKTKYFQMQTRSADEPMTTFVTCMVCGNRWKFC